MKVLEEGLPYTTIEQIQEKLGMSFDQVAGIMQVSARTLERRKAAGKLDSQESDRAIRLLRVFIHVCDLYGGDEKAARAWLKRENPALDGFKPEEMISSESGAVFVEDLLGRLEHGVFS
jgi:putative toxin-antitoxin system antitoxin component (TIGR02293 family)